MRRMFLNVFGPLLALAVVALVVAFPKPTDTNLTLALAPDRPTINNTQTEGSYVGSLFTAHAEARYTPALASSLEQAQSCLNDLASSSEDERRACAPHIVEALIAIDLAERGKDSGIPLPEPDPTAATLQSQIAVAAIDLCREDWLRSADPRRVPDTAICRAANTQLVSIPQNP